MILVYFSCWGLLVPPHLAPQVWGQDRQGETTPGERSEPAHARLKLLAREFAQLSREARDAFAAMDASSYDPEYIVKQVGDDPETLRRWVTENTFLVPYQGILRGPRGVLMDRLGSHADRAFLLAELLKQAGHQVRLARSTLDRDQASRVLSQQRVPHDRKQHLAAMRDVEPGREQPQVGSGEATGMEMLEEMVARTITQTEQLADMLAEAQIEQTVDAGAMYERRLNATADYWWVHVGEGPALQELHLLELNPELQDTHALDAIPEDALHRVTVRVLANVVRGDEVSDQTVLEHTYRPYEHLTDSVRLTFVPLDWPQHFLGEIARLDQGQATKRFREVVLAQGEWLPTLKLGQKSIDQSSVLVNGEVNPEPMKAVANRRIGKAATALGELGRARAEGGAWLGASLEVDVNSPATELRTVRRTIFDIRNGPPAAGSAGQAVSDDAAFSRGLGLLSATALLAQTCDLSPQFLQALMLRDVANYGPVTTSAITTVATSLESEDKEVDLPRVFESTLRRADPSPFELYALAFARRAWVPEGTQVFLDEPNLLALHTRPTMLRDRPALTRWFDVMSNHVSYMGDLSEDVADTFAPAQIDEVSAFRANLRQGVADTAAESIIATSTRSSEATVVGTASSTSDLMRATGGDGWVVLDPKQPGHLKVLDDLPVSEDHKNHMRNALAAGATVVAPPSVRVADSDENQFGWWRIEPGGTSLGIGLDGMGFAQDIPARVMFQAIAAGIAAAVLGFMGCYNMGDDSGDKLFLCGLCALWAGAVAFYAVLIPATLAGVTVGIGDKVLAKAVQLSVALCFVGMTQADV